LPEGTVGSFAFVLHSHIPYVLSHGRWPHGTDWLLEVTAETYIPLLNALNDLVAEGYSPKITIGLTPVLAEQLADESFQFEFAAYARMRAKMAAEDKKHFAKLGDDHCAYLADFWHQWYWDVLNSFKKRYRRNLAKAFKELQDAGHIEIITSSATHGYSPLLSQDVSVQAQVKQGVQTYKKHFGRQPRGYWLPECAYRPGYRWSPPVQPKGHTIEPYLRKGVEEFLHENGIRFFFAESHLLEGGETDPVIRTKTVTTSRKRMAPRGVYADRFGLLGEIWEQFAEEYPDIPAAKTVYQPYAVSSAYDANDPVYVFFRDHVTGSQVWSRSMGYPGSEWYLEFHKKHSLGGLRYWRVTGPDADLGDKLIYDPQRAEEDTGNHTGHFLNAAKTVLREYQEQTGQTGCICAPYDTELYGHWWFEGVSWLHKVLKAMCDDPEIELTTCSEYLEKNPSQDSIALPEGSWGEGGFHYMWLNQNTEWTWPCVYDAELEMQALVKDYADNKDVAPILKQAARELLLLQSSDWQFSISTGSSKEYGEQRLTEHYKCLMKLGQIIRKKAAGQEIDPADWTAYKICEERDCLFQDVDPKWWAAVEKPAKENG
jgi:1,4-alpha-glucan branching enzyme